MATEAVQKEKLAVEAPPLYDAELKAYCDQILQLEDDVVKQEPFIPFEQVVRNNVQWWIKPGSSARKRGRCVIVKWDTPAQKVLHKALQQAYEAYREAYLAETGGRNLEEECDALKAKVIEVVGERMKQLANKYHVAVPYFRKLYQTLQVRREKATSKYGGLFVQWRTVAIHVPPKTVSAYVRQIKSKSFAERGAYPYCTFCRWVGHQRQTCDDYADAPMCSYCRYKGHELARCYKAPICEHCLEKGHETEACQKEARCRFCKAQGHVARECAKLKKVKCHKCGRNGHTAYRCFDFDDDDDDEDSGE